MLTYLRLGMSFWVAVNRSVVVGGIVARMVEWRVFSMGRVGWSGERVAWT